MIVPIVCFLQSIHSHPFFRSLRTIQQICTSRLSKSVLVFCCIIALFVTGCSVRNAEYDQLISNGDYVQAKELIRRLHDEFSYRDENPSMPARRAQLYYWLANAHGKLAEYDSLKLALSLSVSNDPGFEEARTDLLREYSLLEYNKGVSRYNEAVYHEAIAAWANALDLAEPQHSAYAALIYRHLGFAEVKRNDRQRALRSLTRAEDLNDNVSRELLKGFKSSGSLEVPDVLQKIDNTNFETSPLSAPQPAAEDSTTDHSSAEIDEGSGSLNDLDESIPSDTVKSSPSWTTTTLTSQDIARFPFRGVDSYLPLINGVVNVNRGLHVRGSRAGETGYRLNGISVLNPFLNSNGIPLIPEAIERLDIHTGAYGPELGSMNGGMVESRMKTGGDELRYSFSIQSDDFVKPGNQYSNTSAYGFRNVVGTAGGPLPIPGIDLKFFLAGEHHFMRNRQPIFLEPFQFEGLVTDNYGSRPPGEPLPGPVEAKRNHVYNNWVERNSLQGNATVSLAGIDLMLIASYANEVNPDGNQWPFALQNIFAQKRARLNKVTTKFAALQASYRLREDASVRLSMSYHDRFQRLYDPDFKHNWLSYTDSLNNSELGYLGFVSRYQGPRSYSTIFAFNFNHPSTPNNQYSKNQQSGLSLSVEANAVLTPFLEVDAGGTIEAWTIRSFSAQNIRALHEYMDLNRDGVWDRTFASAFERKVLMTRSGNMAYYGYDMMGAELDDGPDGPRSPMFTSAYVNTAFKDGSFVFRLGARYESLESGNLTYPNILDPTIQFDQNLNALQEESLQEQESFRHFLPRFSASYESDGNVFYASYGRYLNLPPLSSLYISNVTLNGIINPLIRVPYNLGGSALTFTAGPELATQFEFGLQKEILKGLQVSARFYHKTLRNQLQLGDLVDDSGTPVIVGFVNKGQGTAKGIEVSMNLRHGIGYTSLDYSFTTAEGLTSHPRSNQIDVTDENLPPTPVYPIPYDYQQTHRGRLMGGLEFGEEHGPIFDRLSIDIVASFNSGHPYTKIAVARNLGAASPWNIGIRPLLDVRTADPVEPLNASRTPWFFNVDLQVRKAFLIDRVGMEISLVILNLFNRKHILNVFPNSGSPNDDTWLYQSFADNYRQIPLYEEFYRTINLQNRWAYIGATGNDVYGTPRQIRLGLKVGM